LTEAQIAGDKAREKHGSEQQRDRLHNKAALNGCLSSSGRLVAEMIV